MADISDILNDNEEQLNEDELMHYLENDLSAEDKYAFEQKLSNEKFVHDALEGLKKYNNEQHLRDSINYLNKFLEKQLKSKKQRDQKKNEKELPLILLTALFILLVCVIGYFVIQLYYKG